MPGNAQESLVRLAAGGLGNSIRKIAGARLAAGLIIAVAISARMVLAWGLHGNFDQDSYELVQGIVRAGGNVYAETNRYNYAPPWFLALAGFAWVQDITGLAAHGVIRTFLILVDVAMAGVLYAIGRRMGLSPGRGALLFLASPVMILVTGYQGPIDGLAALFIWVAVLVQLERPRIWLSSAWCLFGVLIKPVVAPAPLYALALSVPSYQRRLLMLAVIGACFALAFLPWAAEGREGIVANVMAYGAAGSSSPGQGPSIVGLIRLSALVGGGAIATRLPIDRALLVWALLTIVTQPFGPEQQYILPIAAGALRPGIGFALYSAAATVALLGSPDSLHLRSFGQLGEVLVWLTALGWLLPVSLGAAVREIHQTPAST